MADYSIHPVSITKDDLERVVAHPEEASSEQLLAVEGILTIQAERANERLKAVVKARQAIDFADLSTAFFGCDAMLVNSSVQIVAKEVTVTDLVYDQKAMNLPTNKTASAPYREHREVLKPKLIEAAIKDGTFPADFHGSIETSKKVNVSVIEVKSNG